MFIRVVEFTWRAVRRPSILGLSAAGTVGVHLAYRQLAADAEFWMLPTSTMPWVALALCAWGWLGLSVTRTALDVIRADFRPRPVHWVPLPVAFEAGVVALALAVPVLALLVFLIVPGLWLALRWSQATMLILDGEARWFEAAGDSAVWTDGRKTTILLVWLAFSAVTMVVTWLAGVAGAVALDVSGSATIAGVPVLLGRIATDAAGLVVVAALYASIDGRPAAF
ncbi:MAG: hypothetical protein R2752_13350 [Vicinamibacterales bacterium]